MCRRAAAHVPWMCRGACSDVPWMLPGLAVDISQPVMAVLFPEIRL